MEECNKRKRVQHDSADSEPESKIHRVNSGTVVNSYESQLIRVDSCNNSSESHLTRVDSCVNSYESELTLVDSGESCFNSEIQDDLFNILDSEMVAEHDSAIQGLDSVMKSFEEEILVLGSGLDLMDPNSVPDSSELLQPNLGYLFEASDDELGLPPTVQAPGRVNPNGVDLTGFMGLEDDIPNYDAFEFVNELVAECDGDNGGAQNFAAMDGLFDYADVADILWQSESLQAM